MQELIRLSNTVTLQIVCDTLEAQGIAYRVDNAGMHSLMPLPSVMDARVMVEAKDMAAAERIVADLEVDR